MSTDNLLPDEFAELEPFATRWALETERERYAARLGSSMEDMQALYDAAMPRMAEALECLDTFDVNDLPDAQRQLMRLYFSVVNVSFPIEAWKQPHVPDSGAAYMDLVEEPVI